MIYIHTKNISIINKNCLGLSLLLKCLKEFLRSSLRTDRYSAVCVLPVCLIKFISCVSFSTSVKVSGMIYVVICRVVGQTLMSWQVLDMCYLFKDAVLHLIKFTILHWQDICLYIQEWKNWCNENLVSVPWGCHWNGGVRLVLKSNS